MNSAQRSGRPAGALLSCRKSRVPRRGDHYAGKFCLRSPYGEFTALIAPKQIPSSNVATPNPINIPSSKNRCDCRRDSSGSSRCSRLYLKSQTMLAMKHPPHALATAQVNLLPPPGLGSIDPKAQMVPNSAITTKEVKKPAKKLSPSINRVGVRSLECQYSNG